jgi:putative CocE/NonD family hydrolase
MIKVFSTTTLALLFLITAAAQTKPEPKVDLMWGVKIPMRDGVKLNATIYKPGSMSSPLPIIFTLTPYIGDSYHARADYFAKNGYVFALVDVRGRGSSEGKFNPMLQEAKDGYDVVEWLAKQPFCNGKVTMWGGSYAGYDQWATVKEFPPHLKTIVPAAAVYPGLDFPMRGNVTYPYVMQWLTYTSGATGNTNIFGEGSFWKAKALEIYQNGLPFNTLDKVVGNDSTVFQTFVQHPHRDSFWDAMVPTDADFAKMDLPILTITGHYDADQPGAMEFYKRLDKNSSPTGRENHYLIIGPYDHPGTRTPKREVGGLTFGEKSVLDLNKLHREWYDWTMKDGPKPEFLKRRISYYVVGDGAEDWKYADSLDMIANEHRMLYLGSNEGRANDVFQSGSLASTKPFASQPDKYTYDPLDVRPAEIDKIDTPNYLTDQSPVLNLFGNGLVYHSEPFTEPTEITGFLKFSVWLAMDVSDTDLAVDVYEILPNGESISLTSDLMRARYRESPYTEKLVKRGEVNQFNFTGFTFFSRRIAKGSRLRLVIHCPNSFWQEKNYNSGGEVAAESKKDARTAHITLYHDPDHPSFLELPIVK